jgi:hypothetical protein
MDAPANPSPSPSGLWEKLIVPIPNQGLLVFGAAVALLFVFRFVSGLLVVPQQVVLVLSIVNTILFICIPIYGILHGAAHPWKPSQALIFLVLGVAVQVSMALVLRGMPRTGLLPVLLNTLGQTGLLLWCMGLGALLATLIKDKNILVPAAIFLAGFDVFLVTNPYLWVGQVLSGNQEVLKQVAMTVPTATAAPTEPAAAPVQAGIAEVAFVGPADLLFAAFFLTLLFRFAMETRKTGAWLGPALVVYMAIVMITFLPLPALVPIGIVILWFNWRQFSLSKDEKLMTWFVAVLSLGLAATGIFLRLGYKPPARPADSSPSVVGPEIPEPADSLEPLREETPLRGFPDDPSDR